MAAGARQFITTSFVPDPRAFMRRWAQEVVPRLARSVSGRCDA
jgi:hypothetical protein